METNAIPAQATLNLDICDGINENGYESISLNSKLKESVDHNGSDRSQWKYRSRDHNGKWLII